MLEIQDVSIVFNQGTFDENKALKNINLKVEKGDFVTVIGSNGAGKSTLFNVISGNLNPSAGKIFLGGKDITKLPEYKRSAFIGRIFQNPLLGTAGRMSLLDNMTVSSKKGWKGLRFSQTAKVKNQFKKELEKLNMNLENRLNDNVEQFSGGQRQALTLLMAVMSKPEILLLDEHTAALDPSNAEIVMNLTKQFANEYNLTVMMITHNMQHAISYGNRLIMMDKGEIILDISGKEKENLTLEDLNLRFRQIRKTSITTDRLVLQ